MNYLTRLYVRMREARGQTFTEYALIMGLVVLISIAGYTLLGQTVQSVVNTVASDLAAAV